MERCLVLCNKRDSGCTVYRYPIKHISYLGDFSKFAGSLWGELSPGRRCKDDKKWGEKVAVFLVKDEIYYVR